MNDKEYSDNYRKLGSKSATVEEARRFDEWLDQWRKDHPGDKRTDDELLDVYDPPAREMQPMHINDTLPLWRIYACPRADLNGATGRGHTKGEARADLRRRYRLDRLPPGTGLERVKKQKESTNA